MARRYDAQTTTFSPEGRLYQVEYAMAALQNAPACVGILAKDGVCIAAEKKITAKLLAPAKSSEKMYKIDEHVFTAVAGLTADANILINFARVIAQKHKYKYGADMPVESLVQVLADYKHSYTQQGGLRPFGVGFLFAGWDKHHGYQLYQSDPSGNYSGWKATAMGMNSQSATSTLKSDYKEDMTLAEAEALAVRILTKAMDTTNPSAEKVEVMTLQRAEVTPGRGQELVQRYLTSAEVDALITSTVAPASGAGPSASSTSGNV
jgi:20S proteasome subunit alpha 3